MTSDPGVESDARARRIAQSAFERPLVLVAGAGTGKTAALVARLIVWCLDGGWERERERIGRSARGAEADEPMRVAPGVLQRIVAITFTEAAAAEMADRTADALREIAAGTVPRWIARDLLPDEPARRERAAALLRALDQLGVRTIHAFCRRLLAEHPLEAGLHPRFEIDADESRQKQVIREVVEASLPQLLADPADLAELARARPPKGPADLEAVLLELLRLGVTPAALAGHPLEPQRVRDFAQRLGRELGRFVADFGVRLASVGGRAAETVDALQRVSSHATRAQPETRSELDALLTLARAAHQECGQRLASWSRGQLSKGEERAVGPSISELRDAATRARRELDHAAAVDPALLVATQRLLHGLLARVEKELRRRGIESFALLLRDARDLLALQPAVASRVRERIDQVLVDEFQDTDRIQCELLEHLVLRAPEAERPGLFLVADPKQSIYGWRDADLLAYDDFLDRVRKAGGDVHSLCVNRRSVPEILDEVERLIEPCMEERYGVQPRFERLLADPEKAHARGIEPRRWAAVEHWVSWDWSDRDGPVTALRAIQAARLEARALAHDLTRLQAAGVPWSRIGVLFRGIGDVESYLAELRAAGIPFFVEGDRSYFQRREIVEASALVRCVLDPGDELALLAVLRSGWVGVPDCALVPLWSRGLPGLAARLHGDDAEMLATLAARVAEVALDPPSGIPGLERIAGWEQSLLAALEALARLRASFEEDPADVFVERMRTLLLHEVTEAARHPAIYRIANLDRFFRDFEVALQDGAGDPQVILRAMRVDVAERREAEEGRPREGIEDAVQVMTIHKAKGLDFDHVYVVQLHKGRGRSDEARAEMVQDRFECRLLGVPTLGYACVEARRAEVEEAERVRTLYVALTRARERLVVAGMRGDGARGPRETSHAALLERRRGERPDLLAAMRGLAASGTAFVDGRDARWVFPGLQTFFGDASARRPPPSQPLFEVERVEAGARALELRRAEAKERMRRPFRCPVSASAHEAAEEAWNEDATSEGDEREPVVEGRVGALRDAAMLSGSAVHRALERIDLEGDLEAGLRRAAQALHDERARELLEGLASGPLLARLREIAPHVIARELPVLLPPAARDAGGPVGFLAGAVDLLYSEPATGELVVADWKTDRIEGPADLEEKLAIYALQGAGYVRAVREALGLDRDPRFELWLLDTGQVVTIAPSNQTSPLAPHGARR